MGWQGHHMTSHSYDTTPIWGWAAPAAASLLLVLKFSGIVPSDAGSVLILAGLLLGGAVFAAVHHAEVLALRLGEPFGSILLAIAVTVIEVALIVSIMLSGSAGSDAVARIPRRFGLDPIRDIQVLCPMNRGGVGARSLNIEL